MNKEVGLLNMLKGGTVLEQKMAGTHLVDGGERCLLCAINLEVVSL
jgi:hypothetical protein